MSLPSILFILYLGIGLIVALVITLTDAAKKRISGAGMIGDLASLHMIAFLIFLTLWPLWLGLLWFGSDHDEHEKPKIGGSTPNEPEA